MRRNLSFLALLVLAAAAVFAQTRESVRIYVQSAANNPAHELFFKESFSAEIEAAGYGLAYRAAAADYILNLAVRPNIILYNDGTEAPAPPGEKQFILQFGLVRNRDNAEIVAFSFPFTDMAEVEPYNQYLFNQVMSNLPYSVPDYTPAEPLEVIREVPMVGDTLIIRQVPVEVEVVREVPVEVEVIREVQVEVEVVREVPVPVEVEVVREVPVPVEVEVVREILVPVEIEVIREVQVPVEVEVVKQVPVEVITEREVLIEESDSWRNKWLYLRASADLPISYFQVKPGQDLDLPVDDKVVMIPPGATLGLELQFMPWMSVEVDFVARFADVIDVAFIPGAALQIKFPLKPSRYFMLEPYATASISLLNMTPHSDTPYYLEAGGGFQLGVKGGKAGAWFVDLSYKHTLFKEVRTLSPEISWNRFVIGLGVGYKMGFIDR